MSWSLVPAADVGGVGHPVACGNALPGGGDVDVDAEHAGQDGGGDRGGEREEGGRAGLPGPDADLAEAFAELVWADRLARASAGQQPRGGGPGSRGGGGPGGRGPGRHGG